MPATPAFHRQLSFPGGPVPVSEGIAFTRRTLTTWVPRTEPTAGADIVLVGADVECPSAEVMMLLSWGSDRLPG